MKEDAVRALVAVDGELSRRFRSAADLGLEPDWEDVVNRAGSSDRSGRRWIRPKRAALLAAGAAALVAAVTPALGLDRLFLSFGDSESAPERTQVAFGALDTLDPAHGPGALTEETRLVHTFQLASGTYELTVSPAVDGFCWGISGFGLTCENSQSRVIDPFYRDIPADAQAVEPVLIAAAVRGTDISAVRLTFQDGATMEVPLVVVSEPIAATFVLYELPRERWQAGSRPSRISAYSPSGEELGAATFMYALTN
jgi:hypothetical protein